MKMNFLCSVFMLLVVQLNLTPSSSSMLLSLTSGFSSWWITAESRWAAGFCSEFFVNLAETHTANFAQGQASSSDVGIGSIDTKCEQDVTEKLTPIISKDEHPFMQLLASLCIEVGIHRPDCANLLVVMKKTCWRVQQVILFLMDLRKTSAVREMPEFALRLEMPGLTFISFDTWFKYHHVPMLNSSLCAFEFATTEIEEDLPSYQKILSYYKTWVEDSKYGSPYCNCSEVLTLRKSLFTSADKTFTMTIAMDQVFKIICMPHHEAVRKIGNWSVPQLREWRAQEMENVLSQLPIQQKIDNFILLSVYGDLDWIGPDAAESVRRVSHMLTTHVLIDLKILAFSSNFTLAQVQDLFELNDDLQYIDETCKLRLLKEVILNPSFVQDKITTRYWHNNISGFQKILHFLMVIVNEDVIRNLPEAFDASVNKITMDCDLLIWNFIKIQEVIYGHPKWGITDVESILGFRLEFIDTAGVRHNDALTLEDAYLCTKALSISEKIIYDWLGTPNETEYSRIVAEYRRDFLMPEHRELCYLSGPNLKDHVLRELSSN